MGLERLWATVLGGTTSSPPFAFVKASVFPFDPAFRTFGTLLRVMAVCNNCYIDTCARTVNPGVACDCTDFAAYVRLPSGTYGSDLMAHVPPSASTMSNTLIDAASGYTTPAGVLLPLTAGAIALYNGGAPIAGAAAGDTWHTPVAGGNGGELFHMVSLFKHYPTERVGILDHLERLSLTAGTAAAKTDCRNAGTLCTQFLETAEKLAKEVAKTPDMFEDSKYPLARMYLGITKACTASSSSVAKGGLTQGKFDPATGLASRNFEKLPPVTTMNMFHCVKDDFQKTIYAIGNNGGRLAWEPFWQIIRDLAGNRNDHTLLHELVFETLSALDRKQTNIVSFMQQQWTTFFTCFMSKWGENEAASGDDPSSRLTDSKDDQGIKPDGGGFPTREHVKFGPVTLQGQAAGEMRTRKGFMAYCNKWNEFKVCTSGVFEGRNKGKCAYCHRCRWCGKGDHRAEEKHPAGHAQAGEFICPKHT